MTGQFEKILAEEGYEWTPPQEGEKNTKEKSDYYEGRDAEGRYHPDNPNQAFWHDDGVEFIGNPYGDSYFPLAAESVPFNYGMFGQASPDTISFSGSHLPGGLGDDHISFASNTFNLNMDNEPIIRESTNGFWKYEEDLTLKEVQDYLSGTYKSHYTSQESKTQTLDLIESIGDAEAFCRSNAIKYLSRFGKKNGKSKLDILKAIHYCVLLYHFSGLHTNNTNGYETF
jgi:hypothetical protein